MKKENPQKTGLENQRAQKKIIGYQTVEPDEEPDAPKIQGDKFEVTVEKSVDFEAGCFPDTVRPIQNNG